MDRQEMITKRLDELMAQHEGPLDDATAHLFEIVAETEADLAAALAAVEAIKKSTPLVDPLGDLDHALAGVEVLARTSVRWCEICHDSTDARNQEINGFVVPVCVDCGNQTGERGAIILRTPDTASDETEGK